MAEKPKKILLIGDSLTEFFDWEARFPEHAVMNFGVAGETAEGLLYRLERIHSRIDKPDYIFIMTGANNIAMEDYGITDTYREILEDLRSRFKEARLVVQSVLPMELPWVGKGVIRHLNESLREMAGEFNAQYLDLYRLFTDSEGTTVSDYLLNDGVHVSDEGYEVWSEAVEEFLKSKDR